MTPLLVPTLLVVLAAAAAESHAQQRSMNGAARGHSAPSPVLTQPARRSVENLRDVLKHDSRTRIENAVRNSTGGDYRVTSRDRQGGPLASRAHDRGAVDIVTPRIGTPRQFDQARDISRRLGPNFNATVEQVYGGQRPGQSRYVGPAFDRHTTYNNGRRGNTRIVPPRATNNHIHVQPNYGIDVPWRSGDAVR
jgi:hypothetical protein